MLTQHADLRNHGPRNHTLPDSPNHPHPARVQELHSPGLDGRGPGRGASLLTNALAAEDTELTAAALTQLGAGIDWQGTTIRVRGRNGRWLPASLPIYLGNSGTSMRFLTALAALGEGEYLLTGTERLCQGRPRGVAGGAGPGGGSGRLRARRRLPPGAGFWRTTGGKGPASGKPWQPGTSRPCCSSGLWRRRAFTIEITGELVSRPYVDLTLEVLGAFGISYYREGYRSFELPGGQTYLPRGIRDRGRRLQRLVFLGRGGRNRRAGHHYQPEP